jgi:hypothetical protein
MTGPAGGSPVRIASLLTSASRREKAAYKLGR